VDNGFPYGDIIVIGAIAAFIILRYRAMLGEQRGRDAEAMKPARPLEEYERVIQLPDREPAPQVRVINAPAAKDYGSLNPAFAAMKGIDRNFSPESFLEGARGAFEMIIDAYNKRDDETLKLLLSPRIYGNFQETIREDEAAGRLPHTTLVAILSAKIADARLVGKAAQITVDFSSEQIHLVRDRDGKIVEGDPSQQAAIEDRWVFERNLSSADPNWKVIET
jgi:predicted lipid-binding transport protein (Tim44 family)